MKKRGYWLSALACVMLLSSCGKIEKSVTTTNQNSTASESATTGMADKTLYESITKDGKFTPGVARDYEASALNSNYNLDNFEEGLLRLSKKTYPTADYYFQAGQYISEDQLRKWLGRYSASNKEGLNPEDTKSGSPVQQVLEYDFLDKKEKKLNGIFLGIALNQVDYSAEGEPKISAEEMEKAGKAAADAAVAYLRSEKETKDVPITVALFKQAEKTDLAGGVYFQQGSAKADAKKAGDWQAVNETYVLLPTDESSSLASKDGTSSKFKDFQNSVNTYFADLSGVIGVAHYVDDKLQEVNVTINTKYYNQSEIETFAQFAATKADSQLAVGAPFEILISSIEGPQAYISKTDNDSKIQVHIFS